MPLLPSKSTTILRIRISDKKYALLVRSFATDLTALQTAKITLLNRNTVNRYFAYFRRQIITQAIKERKEEEISNGVEIDESYFGPKRQRGKRGRGAGRKTVVLGLLERNGKVYAQIIPDASKEEILPIIRQTVKSGADIYTDGWMSYDALAVYGHTTTRRLTIRKMTLLIRISISTGLNHSGAGQNEDWPSLTVPQNHYSGFAFLNQVNRLRNI